MKVVDDGMVPFGALVKVEPEAHGLDELRLRQ
jgi:hypothetical protein